MVGIATFWYTRQDENARRRPADRAHNELIATQFGSNHVTTLHQQK